MSTAALPVDETVLNAALAEPAQRERWKYTARDKALALLPAGGLAPLATEPDGTSLHVVGEGLDAFLPVENLLAAMPEALLPLAATPLSVVEVPAGASVALSLEHTTHVPPTLVRIGANASLTLTERFVPREALTQWLWLELSPGARVEHNRNMLTDAPQWQVLSVSLARDASYDLNLHSTGATFNRQDIHLRCAEPGASAELTAAACIAAGAHLDQQVTVQHERGNNSSRQTIHNIAGAGAQVTCNGRIHIHPGAPGSSAHLTNRNLCLGDATVNTKPELEIYTDDVQCSHGATVGRLDEQQLFYAVSRGIDPDSARHLLSQAFLRQATLGVLAEESQARFAEVIAGG